MNKSINKLNSKKFLVLLIYVLFVLFFNAFSGFAFSDIWDRLMAGTHKEK